MMLFDRVDRRSNRVTAPLHIGVMVGAVLCVLPIIGYLSSLLSWLVNGFDLPYYDDWRIFNAENIGSFSSSRLFAAAGGTLAPLGYFLDDLAQIFLRGNSIAYQTITYSVVMGALLCLQWVLLRRVLRDFVLCAACFSLTIYMLQPGSYWGAQNMAYHQALPLVFILGIIRLMLANSMRDRLRQPCVLILALLAGLTYISGAFAVLTTGVFFLCFSWVLRKKNNQSGVPLRRAGVSLTLIGSIAAYAHCYWALLPRNGINPHPVVMAWPTELDFWCYVLGKLARALMLPQGGPSMLIAIFVGGGIFLSICWAGGRFLFKESSDDKSIPLLTIVGPLFFVVLVYLMMVAAGRTNWRSPDINTPLKVFEFGMLRFHYFWVTLWWPWCLACVCFAIQGCRFVSLENLRRLVLIVASLLMLHAINSGAYKHNQYFQETSSFQLGLRDCLIKGLQEGRPLKCPQVDFISDLSRAYSYARKMQSSFVQSVPVLPLPEKPDFPASWLRYSRDKTSSQFVWLRVTNISHDGVGGFVAGEKAQLFLNIPENFPAKACRILELGIRGQGFQKSMVHVFYKADGQDLFQAGYSTAMQLQEAPVEHFGWTNFIFESQIGFGHSLRIDFDSGNPSVSLGDVDLRCKLLIPD